MLLHFIFQYCSKIISTALFAKENVVWRHWRQQLLISRQIQRAVYLVMYCMDIICFQWYIEKLGIRVLAMIIRLVLNSYQGIQLNYKLFSDISQYKKSYVWVDYTLMYSRQNCNFLTCSQLWLLAVMLMSQGYNSAGPYVSQCAQTC